jgi:hypothetical protein
MKIVNLFWLALHAMPTLTISTLAVSGWALFAQSAAPVRLAIHPGVAAPIVIKTAPSAACTLRPEGSSDPVHSLRLDADQAGVIRFYARPGGPSTARLEL